MVFTTLDLSKQSGVVETDNLGSGTASSSTVLFGDQTFKTAPSGTHVLLETINVSSGVSHIDSSAIFSSTYKNYLVIGRMVRPQTNATNLRFRYLEVGGSLMNSSAYNYQEVYSLNSGLGRNYHSSATFVQLTNSISNSGDNGAFGFNMYLKADRSTGTDNALQYYWQGSGATGGDAIYSAGGGWYDSNIATDPPEKIRFYFDSGNIAIGKFSIYGISGAI